MIRRVRHWLRDRCAHCGHRFRWKRDTRHSHGGNREVFHAPCIGYQIWRAKADERLAILDVVCEVWAVSDRDLKGVVEMRAVDDTERVQQSDRAFRVFYDLQNSRKADAS